MPCSSSSPPLSSPWARKSSSIWRRGMGDIKLRAQSNEVDGEECCARERETSGLLKGGILEEQSVEHRARKRDLLYRASSIASQLQQTISNLDLGGRKSSLTWWRGRERSRPCCDARRSKARQSRFGKTHCRIRSKRRLFMLRTSTKVEGENSATVSKSISECSG